MGIAITKIDIEPKEVETGKRFKISVAVKEITKEPTMYRTPFRLGQEKGGIR